MRNTFLYGAMLVGLGLLIYGFTLSPAPAAAAGAAKNLQVFPKNTPKKELKKAMKQIAKALDVQCDHCHDLDDMSKDTDNKKIARDMMRMTMELNKKYFKGKQRVTCMTCHNGAKEPK
ncbi:MAG: c-type cytochrome [Deltaproteobacteria bacterium]|nr:MAG: c-type cytochrome [Deltaproteobacteria bacterium]